MKKIFLTAVLGLLMHTLWAQNATGVKTVLVSRSKDTLVNGTKFTFQVGLPYLGLKPVLVNGQYKYQRDNTIDVRFPWDVRYFYKTFAEESFDISKGYFGDKVLITWDIRANIELVKNIKIYRRVFNPLSPTATWGNPLVTLAKEAKQYEDKYTQGGILYEYKVFAEILNQIGESKYDNFISGVGFRNPTAVVTGAITYKGGSPVKDVTVTAVSQGGGIISGTALSIAQSGNVAINLYDDTKLLKGAFTLQAWAKPATPYTNDAMPAINLFKVSSSKMQSTPVEVTAALRPISKILEINIAGYKYQLKDYYPSGNTDARGNDILVPVSDFNTNFVNFTVVMQADKNPSLFINGRPISTAYRDEVVAKLLGADTLKKTFAVIIPPVSVFNNTTTASLWNAIKIGDGAPLLVDELRIWNKALDTAQIRTDYRRFIDGNNINLVSYLSANEAAGEFAYDQSRTGFEYNKNNGKLTNTAWVKGSGNAPTADQLGVLGVTDVNGTYQITAIPYSGNGESFVITPMYGQHEFEPSKQLIFLGLGSEVANKIDFVDKSSFSFKGKVLYDSRDVFPSYVNLGSTLATDKVVSGNIIDEFYNYYDVGGKTYYKGEWWYNNNKTPSNKLDDYLERYASIYVDSANLYIDGNMVFDENNIPVVTNKEGFFDISVPIGKHYISVKKNGHTFSYNGRFPASGTKEFYEDANQPVIFIDSTRVTVIGKVVGGPVEAAKAIGFGENGLFKKTIQNAIKDSQGQDSTFQDSVLIVSSKNNIGVANFTLGYAAGGIAPQPITQCNFSTNKTSGEYRVALLPIPYQLSPSNVKIPKNPSYTIIDGNIGTQTLDYSGYAPLQTPKFNYKVNGLDSSISGKPYHFEKSFTYRSQPEIRVLEQTSDETIKVNNQDVSTEGMPYPIVEQFKHGYKIKLKCFEPYANLDSTLIIKDTVAVIDAKINITNNAAYPNSETLVMDAKDNSIINYTFRGGFPRISPPFTKTLSISAKVGNLVIKPTSGSFKDSIIVLGGESDGGKEFTTAAPDVAEIVLRDPPGSNSFASIEKGTTISLSQDGSLSSMSGIEAGVKIMAGTKMAVTTGAVPGPIVESELINSAQLSVGLSHTSTDGKSLSKSYSFNQTLSTSDDPNWVGADADLYIGNSKNYFNGSFDNVQLSDAVIGASAKNLSLKNKAGREVFISTQKKIYMVEEPTNTFFVYSQKYILETLIPQYELFINQIDNKLLTPGKDGVKTKAAYLEQIKLWKAVILENELSKYTAKYQRADYKKHLDGIVKTYSDDVATALKRRGDDPVALANLKNRLEDAVSTKNMMDEQYEDNVSFDAGVGEVTRSVTSTVVNTSTKEYTLSIDQSLALQFGFKINDAGLLVNVKGKFQQDINSSFSESDEKVSTFSYTLKDNDEANVFSVDVVNNFDGHGPIFSTLGGRSSCPYEGSVTSKFFPEAKFKAYYQDLGTLQAKLKVMEDSLEYYNDNNWTFYIKKYTTKRDSVSLLIKSLDRTFKSGFDCCANENKVVFSDATMKVEKPVISVKESAVSNVMAGKNAEFELVLENNSSSGSDLDFLLKVDNKSNPNNALINIEPNGTIVNVPYGKTVIYKMTLGKSISDVYDYDSIKVVLQSLCDGEDVSASVYVSASFIPACTPVVIMAPAGNWVYNRLSAFNADKTTNPLKIEIGGYTTGFNSFEKIILQYRLSSSSEWKFLKTYYANQTLYDNALKNGEKAVDIQKITGAKLTYLLNIPSIASIIDGDYEIKATSYCSGGTIIYQSDIIKGRVDLNAPERFGTPLPTDGILGAGEDLKVSFNEPINYISGVSIIEIEGEENQLPVKNDVSIRFEGAQNTALINDPKIATGDFTLEFWLQKDSSAATANATILNQDNGIKIGLENDQLYFTIGGQKAKGAISDDNAFHHYTFTHKNSTGDVSIYQDDKVIAGSKAAARLQFTNNNDLVIGGNTFIGNMHNLRIWNKSISLPDAYSNMYKKMQGNEANLIGYWQMDEGRGAIAADKARFKHAIVNASWDIKPKGTSYDFAAGQYLTLDNVGKVQLNNEMDATISFWMKTPNAQEATIFSNGKGDGTDITGKDSLDNKWAVNLKSTGLLTFESEGVSYPITSKSVADNAWHHVAILLNRLGSLQTYVDAELVSSNSMLRVGGFSGNKVWLGARGAENLAGNVTVDRKFTGKIDEFQIWNTLRNAEQVSRDRYFEVNPERLGLMLYARLNQPDPATANGPRYYHADGYVNGKQVMGSTPAVMSSGLVKYSADAPAIKPARGVTKFVVNQVINNDAMIITPVITNWASVEGQVLDITVHRMFDKADNPQLSPITWTAFVKRNDVSWFADGYNEMVDLVKNYNEAKSFEITVMNKGGKGQSFAINNIPNWLNLNVRSGNLAPDSKIIITATIDKDLSAGEYAENLYLQTDFGFDQKLPIKLRSLAAEPDWKLNPTAFSFNMNIIGKLKVDGKLSLDPYDKVAAYSKGELRGVAGLTYNEAYKEYFVFLTVYSKNENTLENIDFKIWDASHGVIKEATVNTKLSLLFENNAVLGTVNAPAIIENSQLLEAQVPLNSGWTWVSLNVSDPNFSNINKLTENLRLETEDRILSFAPVQLEVYTKDISTPSKSTWSGSIGANGGLSSSKMYKFYTANQQYLNIKGTPVNLYTWTFPIQVNWNWFPYNLTRNQLTNEALAYFDAKNGDVIKSQNLFSIYDSIIGWSGTLKYLEADKGYMIKASKAQTFKFPAYLADLETGRSLTDFESPEFSQETIQEEYTKYAQNMNAVVLLPKGYNELFVYDGKGLLKGKASRTAGNDKELSFITIYGDAPESLTFYVSDGINKKQTTRSFGFMSNDVLGTVSKPVILNIEEDGMRIYPNPFNNDFNIQLIANAGQKAMLKLYSVSNQLVFAKEVYVEKGFNNIKIAPEVEPGIYMLQTEINGKTINSKVIKQ